MPTYLDITPPLSPRLAVWPGDLPFQRDAVTVPCPGGALEIGSIRTTLHAGAHADAPSHYLAGAPAINQLDLTPYLGPCEVVQVALPAGARILPVHCPARFRTPRVLFRTNSYPDPERFSPDFNALSVELVHHLKAEGCLLVGIDTPSVDPFTSIALESHRALGACDLRVLEGLDLRQAAPGLYTLIALPLRIEGGDGSPVRAILVQAGDPEGPAKE